jgi:hypothetical protein
LVSGSLLKSAISSLLQFQASGSFITAGLNSAHRPSRPEARLGADCVPKAASMTRDIS